MSGGAEFDAHHHLWDTRVLEYRLFREVRELDRPFLLADYEQEARALGDRIAVGGSRLGGGRPGPGARLGAGAGRREWACRRPRGVRRARARGGRARPVVRAAGAARGRGAEVVRVRGARLRGAVRGRTRCPACGRARLRRRPRAVSAGVPSRARPGRELPRHAVRARPPRQAGDRATRLGAVGLAPARALGATERGGEAVRARDRGRPFRLDAGRPEAVRGTCASDVRAGQAPLRQRLARARAGGRAPRGGSRR